MAARAVVLLHCIRHSIFPWNPVHLIYIISGKLLSKLSLTKQIQFGVFHIAEEWGFTSLNKLPDLKIPSYQRQSTIWNSWPAKNNWTWPQSRIGLPLKICRKKCTRCNILGIVLSVTTMKKPGIQIFFCKFCDKIKIRQNSINHHQSHPKFNIGAINS